MKKYLLLFFGAALFSCSPNIDDEPVNGATFNKTGYQPIYASDAEVKNIQVQLASPLNDPGKIYLIGKYLLVNERGKGIHIFDNSDPKSPANLSFLSIPSNYDMAVKGKWLYADNAADLVVFDFSDPSAPKLAKRIDAAIPSTNYPPFSNVYFECVDAKKGIVTGWEKVAMETRPKCYR